MQLLIVVDHLTFDLCGDTAFDDKKHLKRQFQ